MLSRVSAMLYAVYTSHPAHAARLMLEHKRVEHEVVNLVPGTHAAAVRARGFHSGTVPALRLHGLAGWPVTWYNARRVGANDTEHVRKTIEMLPPLLDHVDDLLNEGTIGGEQRNAADFQIGTSVRLLMTFADLAPALEGRGAVRFATELMPDYPTGIPAGFVRQEWLEPLRR
jgi:hypothetical protein